MKPGVVQGQIRPGQVRLRQVPATERNTGEVLTGHHDAVEVRHIQRLLQRPLIGTLCSLVFQLFGMRYPLVLQLFGMVCPLDLPPFA